MTAYAGITYTTQIVGPKSTSVPQAGLNSTVRVTPLAQSIVKYIADHPGIDPNYDLLYNPLQWAFPENNTFFSNELDWLQTTFPKVINGRQDAFSLTYASAIFVECRQGYSLNCFG